MPTTALPTYLHTHAGHDRNDPRYTTVGYDVIRSSRDGDQLTLEVTAVVHGATNYLAALDQAKAHRNAGTGVWGYTADRYACGCRWIATSLAERESNPFPPVIFRDHQPTGEPTMPVTLPGVPADEIPAVTLRQTRAFWPVDHSIDTAHDHVAVVKLNGVTGWFLVTWQPSDTLPAGGRWVTFGDAHPYPTVTEALGDVTTVVAAQFV